MNCLKKETGDGSLSPVRETKNRPLSPNRLLSPCYIGGSSCAGKTTAARQLAEKYGLYYYGVDDHLGEFAEYGVRKGFTMCCRHSRMNMDEFLMRSPSVQVQELMEFYIELHGKIMQTVSEIRSGRPVLAEGIAFIPQLMYQDGITPDRYICLAAAPDFQVENYRKREWTDLFLADCRDKETAFHNWMERERLFSFEVRSQACKYGYEVIGISSEKEAENAVKKLEVYFQHICN